MSLTPTVRRTTGAVALLSALLLVLNAVLLAPAASAQDAGTPCDSIAYEKPAPLDASSGSETFDWGSITWGGAGDSAGNELLYEIDEGYTVEFCLKAGNMPPTESGPRTGSGSVTHPNEDLSHVGFRIVPDVPEELCPEGTDDEGQPYEDIEDCDEEPEPTVVTPAVSFADPSCEDLDGAVVDTEEIEGVEYEVEGDVEPGGSVAVTASPAEGFAFPDEAQVAWDHEFATPTSCDDETLPPDDETDVDDDEVEKPQAPPAPPAPPASPDTDVEVLPNVVEKPAPAPAVQAEELAATGLRSTELLLLALLLMGLGGVMLLGPETRREH